MSRGVDGREIFRDDSDRLRFRRVLSDAKKEHGFRIFAYCLMGNHFHLLIQAGDLPLYSGMHHFLTRYSLYFNHRHSRQGHLFQSRYTALLCKHDSYLGVLLQYIHLNPVRAGIVEKPDHWVWSGHLGLVGSVQDSLLDIEDLATMRGETIPELRISYRKILNDADDIDIAAAYPEGRIEEDSSERPPLSALADALARNFGFTPEDLKGGMRGNGISRAKLAFIEKARGHGHRLSEIARILNCSPAAVTLLRKRKS